MHSFAENVLTVFCILFFPLFFVGIINRVKARWAGRKGPSVFQPFYDVARLMKKGEVVSRTTSPVFAIAPSISLAALLCAALLIPVGAFVPFLSWRSTHNASAPRYVDRFFRESLKTLISIKRLSLGQVKKSIVTPALSEFRLILTGA